jgi:hypothetical protein
VTSKNTTELVEGDVVLDHGMRILLDGPARVTDRYEWPGLVLNGDALCDKESPEYDAYIACHLRGQWRHDVVPLPRIDNWSIVGNELATWTVEDPVPFRVVTEHCDPDNYTDPDAIWTRHEEVFDTENEAVGAWESVKRYENTRPIAIYPEPDWSRYSYDGRNPLRK